jgi:uncharacterized protein YqjF (DUF2071 family)
VIDRMSPTKRPRQTVVMRQNWSDLLFLHWPVCPNFLRPLVPQQLDLDLFEGTAYVGLIPFTMTGVRPIGLPPVRGVSAFHETNVRTYVHYRGGGPGVWFFSLDAASSIAVTLARSLFHLPYHRANMFLEREPVQMSNQVASIVYAGVREWPEPLPASYTIRATPEGTVQPAPTGTLEHFLVERYILYALGNDRLFQGYVHHTPYPLQPAQVHSLDESLLIAAGIARPEIIPLAHFSTGVKVEVFALRSVS